MADLTSDDERSAYTDYRRVLGMATTDSARWAAVVARAEGHFIYAVKTTHIYCRPNCKARLARRANVEFFDTREAAEAAGYRACKRCRPELDDFEPAVEKVIDAVVDELVRQSLTPGDPSLDELAKQAGLSKFHFHRMFRRKTGLTPRQFTQALRATDSLDDNTGAGASSKSTPQASEGTQDTPGQKYVADSSSSPATLPTPTGNEPDIEWSTDGTGRFFAQSASGEILEFVYNDGTADGPEIIGWNGLAAVDEGLLPELSLEKQPDHAVGWS